jgi:hypothetical protein
MTDILALTKANSSFSTTVPGLQIAWDSTSLGLLKSCPWKYYLAMIEGWESRRRATPLTYGIWFHEAAELYHKLRAQEHDHDEAVESVIKDALCKSGVRDAEGTFIPWESDDNRRTRFTLVRAVVWYLETYRDDSLITLLRTDGKPAVELSFRIPIQLHTPDGFDYLLCGHLDRVAYLDGHLYVTDYKTSGNGLGSRFFDNFSPSNQMSMYTFAGNIIFNRPLAGVIVDGIQCAVGFARFGRGFAPRTQNQIEEWLEDTMQWIKIAEHYAATQHWPMNDTACSMYGGCSFRGTCSKDPSVRENYLKADFVKRIWDPLVSRED